MAEKLYAYMENKNIYARLSDDAEFESKAKPMISEVETVDEARSMLDNFVSGGFTVKVYAASRLAPQSQAVVDYGKPATRQTRARVTRASTGFKRAEHNDVVLKQAFKNLKKKDSGRRVPKDVQEEVLRLEQAQ